MRWQWHKFHGRSPALKAFLEQVAQEGVLSHGGEVSVRVLNEFH